MTNNKAAPIGLYIHVPFCASKCPYCDFYSARFGEEMKDRFVVAVEEELSSLRRSLPFADETLFSRPLSSVYLGGGTPSVLTAGQLSRLLSAARRRFAVLPGAEITVEVNPSLSSPEDYFAALAEAGVNRVSLGMQSAVDGERKKLGRRAGRAEIERCVHALKAAGIDNISLDIMLGIPLQTKESLKETLDFALSQDVPHLSAYLLSIEEGTPFAKMRGRLPLPDEDTAADFYLYTCRVLEENGYRHYEVSNFCRDGKPGRHNLAYWLGEEYFAVGPGAHAFLGHTRFFQPRSLEGFLAGDPMVYEGEGGDGEEKRLLRLRTDLGVDAGAFKDKEKTVASLQKRGLITLHNDVLRLTDEGFLLSNAVIGALL